MFTNIFSIFYRQSETTLRSTGYANQFKNIVNFGVKRHQERVLEALEKDTDSHKQLEDPARPPGCAGTPYHSAGNVKFHHKLWSLLYNFLLYRLRNKIILFKNFCFVIYSIRNKKICLITYNAKQFSNTNAY